MHFRYAIKERLQLLGGLLHIAMMFILDMIGQSIQLPSSVIHGTIVFHIHRFVQVGYKWFRVDAFCSTRIFDGSAAFTAEIDAVFLKYWSGAVVLCHHFSNCHCVCVHLV